MVPDPNQFFGLPPADLERADAVILPLPVEKTVSYGTGTSGGPRAILDASLQLETFDEETFVDFAAAPRLHTLPPISAEGPIEDCLRRIQQHVRPLGGKFLLALGGEHSVTYGLVMGLATGKMGTGSEPLSEGFGVSHSSEAPVPIFSDALAHLTIVQIDAHADLADDLQGRHWSHGTVMRRLCEQGCRLLQIGVRSLTRSEYDFATGSPRIATYYAHRLAEQWADILAALRGLDGDVYLTIDVDGLDPSVIPSTGTPQPNGLCWGQMMDVLRTVMTESPCRLIGADVVEFVPSPTPPGCDIIAARLVAKVLAWRWAGKQPPLPTNLRSVPGERLC